MKDEGQFAIDGEQQQQCQQYADSASGGCQQDGSVHVASADVLSDLRCRCYVEVADKGRYITLHGIGDGICGIDDCAEEIIDDYVTALVPE